MTGTAYHCQYAWLGGPDVTASVRLTISAGRFTSVTPDTPPSPGDTTLPGLTLPGLANTHSHCFHRALRARVQRDRGTFWTWRDTMYRVADRLTPDTYHALARATYAEMAMAGFTAVGEFHYVHHRPGGGRYDDPNVMGEALLAAAADAGIRITLLDTCYLTGGFGITLAGPAVRFGDGDPVRWADRVTALSDRPGVRIGAAIHSVRAVPAEAIGPVAAWARDRDAPLHVHLSEQPAENEACLTAYGRTPTGVLAERGALGPRTTAVHATHLTGDDIAALGTSGTAVSLCPTTERDLADGIGPARDLADAGSPLCLGSDSQAVIDPFEEARAVELDARLATGRRGHFTAAELLTAATRHDTLGWADAGRIEPGARADLVTLGLDSARLAGTGPSLEAVVFAATAAEVRHVIVDGRVVVAGTHRTVNVPAELDTAIRAVT